jgi:hypothetical protein
MNRLARDEIIHTALDMADLPTLDIKDRPEGVLMPTAISIKWLQHALDTFHHRYPFQTDVRSAEMIMPAFAEELILRQDDPSLPVRHLPEDYMLDVKDGLTMTVRDNTGRLRRRAFQNYLNVKLMSQHTRQPHPVAYCIFNDIIHCSPQTEESKAFVFWYYGLPAVVEAHHKLRGFDDWVAIEYVRLRALEWCRMLPPGTAKEYLNKELASLKSQGLLGDSEWEKLPLGTFIYLDAIQDASPFSWLGTF